MAAAETFSLMLPRNSAPGAISTRAAARGDGLSLKTAFAKGRRSQTISASHHR